MTVLLVCLPADTLVVLAEGARVTTVLADDCDGWNRVFPARRVAENLGQALNTTVRELQPPEHLTEPEDWTYGDVEAWVGDELRKEARPS